MLFKISEWLIDKISSDFWPLKILQSRDNKPLTIKASESQVKK